MKPEILAIAVTVAGFTINLMWTIHNLHVRSELAKMIADLKDYIRNECVDRELCDERHNDVLHRIDAIGA